MPIKYVPYFPNTVEGQAVLNNITRTRRLLQYRDNDRVYRRIERGMPLYEVETIERVGDLTENLLIRGECLSACAYLKDQGITVDLVYIDPPFASGADYAKSVYLRRNPKIAERIERVEQLIVDEAYSNGEEIDIDELRSFEEKMYGDIWNKEDYLNWMYENLTAIKSVMSETASIYLHIDWHIGHYVKILMDEVFGEGNFLDEIIWAYSGRGISKTYWNRKHDCLYFYSKSNASWYFNPEPVREEYSEETRAKFKYFDKKINDWYQIRGKNIQGSPVQRADGLLPEDEVTYAGLTYRQYLGSGMLPKDWWVMDTLNKAANERVDYATQKPIKLVRKIIEASSAEGMVIADFFGGSGVAARVASSTNRKFIHVDISTNSIQVARDVLKEENASFNLLEVKDGVSLYRNPAQTMDKLRSLIPGLQSNIDLGNRLWAGAIQESKQTIAVYLPNLLESSSRILDLPQMNRILNEAMPDLPEEVKKVIVYFIDIDDRDELGKFIMEQNNTPVVVELRDLKEVLDDVVVDDIIEFEVRKQKSGYEVELRSIVSDRLQQEIDRYNQKRGLPLFVEADDEEEDEEEPKRSKKKFSPIEISENGLELIEMVSLDCTSKSGSWTSDSEIKIDKKGFVIRDGKQTRDFWDAKVTSKKKPFRMKVRNIAGDESILALA